MEGDKEKRGEQVDQPLSDRRVIVIAGPTASGKTDLAIELSQKLDAPIISADSRQVYRELNIGVAKPSLAQLAAAPHSLISYVSIHEPYSAGRWACDARKELEKGFAETRTCIIAGGSGLHVQALLDGIPTMPEVSADIRAHYQSMFERDGLDALQRELQLRDEAYAKTVDMANAHRLQRALGAIQASGMTFTALRAQPRNPLPYTASWVILEPERQQLYRAIEQRVDKMMQDGLVEEAAGLASYRHLDALQTIGYRELWPYLDAMCSVESAIIQIKQASRQYARRQLTWNRQKPGLRQQSPNVQAVLKFIS